MLSNGPEKVGLAVPSDRKLKERQIIDLVSSVMRDITRERLMRKEDHAADCIREKQLARIPSLPLEECLQVAALNQLPRGRKRLRSVEPEETYEPPPRNSSGLHHGNATPPRNSSELHDGNATPPRNSSDTGNANDEAEDESAVNDIEEEEEEFDKKHKDIFASA
ncbi:hypothetical protein HK104_005076 [Borealophlyctis nickersoniae]|nr:hypothetical protein HK104_005076 [Borealophlyctis nickersoniae]